MIVLGLILVIVAIAAAVLLFLGTQSLTTPVDLDAVGIKVGLTPLALLIAGAVIMLLLWFGLGMMRGSVKRRRRPSREAKEAQRQAEFEESIRSDERARAEETHQSALADRDRVKDAEFESRLADRDRERDDEFRLREREIEDRARADERARLEREFNARQVATAAAVPAAGAAVAGSSHGDHHDHGAHGEPLVDRHGDELGRHDAGIGHDSAGPERTERVPVADGSTVAGSSAVADDAAVRSGDPAVDPASRAADGSEGERLYSPDDAPLENGEPVEQDAADRPAHRTMADRIMGRDPETRA